MPAVAIRWVACLLMLSALAGAFPAQAQDPAPPAFSRDVKTLYAHIDEDETLDAWMNTLVDDVAGTSITGPAQPVQESFTWSIPLRPLLGQTITLDPAGQVAFSAYVGGGSQSAGVFQVSTKLLLGDQVVAEGAAKQHVVTPAAQAGQDYPLASWSVAPSITTLDAGKELVWTVTIDGTGNGLFLATSDNRGRSNIVLPILDATSGTAPAGNGTNSTNGTSNGTANNTTSTNTTSSSNTTTTSKTNTTTSKTTTTTSGNDTNGTDDAADEKGSPAPTLPALLVAVVAAVVLVRRRLT